MANKNEIRSINIEISHLEKRDDNPDRVIPCSLEKTIKQDDQLCLWGHDSMYVLGRKSAGTLDLRVDDKGLYFEVIPPNANWAKDLVESVHRGDINQMSFGFTVYDEKWIQDKETIKEHGMPIREILGINLYEISIVSFPAYSQSSVRRLKPACCDNTNGDNDIYSPTPPKLEDNFGDCDMEDRNILYDKKIKILKIKNNLIKE